MARVKDKAQHQPTLDAIMAGAVPVRHKTTGEERCMTLPQAHWGSGRGAAGGLAAAPIGHGRGRGAGWPAGQERAFRYAAVPGGKLRTITGSPAAAKIDALHAEIIERIKAR